MAFGFFKRKQQGTLPTTQTVEEHYTFTFNEVGVLYPYLGQPKTELDFYWQDLEQEGFAD